LHAAYGEPRLGNPADPLDDLIYIIVSNRTTSSVASRTYLAIKCAFPDWDSLLRTGSSTLRRILGPAGLSSKKSAQILALLRKIRDDAGACRLDALRTVDTPTAEKYLTSLPGVSQKVAKCVLMYTLDRTVLPVDTHVHRIAVRLAWTKRVRADQCHEELEALVPPEMRRAFHVGCVAHGRTVCRSRAPRCRDCSISFACSWVRQ
jgi:endonuclease III